MEPNEAKLRRAAEKRVEARTGLVTHLTLYVIVNAGLVIIWLLTHAGYPWFVWPLLGWGVGVAGHLLTYFLGPGSKSQERAVERELRRLHGRPG